MIVVGYSMTIVYASYSKPLVYRNPIGPPGPIRPSSPQKIDSDLVLWYMAKSSRHCQRTMWWSRHLENADTVIRCRFVSWWHPAVKVISCGFRQNSDCSGDTSWELKMLLCPVEGHIKHTLSEYVSSIWHQALSFSTIFGPNFVLFDTVCLLTCLIILWINAYQTHYVSFCITLCVILC